MTTGEAHSAFAEVNQHVARAGEILKLEAGVIDAITACERELVISESSSVDPRVLMC
jgi:glutamate dehydrogenase (NAD(P)+)